MPRYESTPALLEMRAISKTFPGVRALDNVRLTVYRGEVHAPMGENGAGKSTLMKILSGAYQADPGGEILVDGKTAVIDGPLAARELGIAVGASFRGGLSTEASSVPAFGASPLLPALPAAFFGDLIIERGHQPGRNRRWSDAKASPTGWLIGHQIAQTEFIFQRRKGLHRFSDPHTLRLCAPLRYPCPST